MRLWWTIISPGALRRHHTRTLANDFLRFPPASFPERAPVSVQAQLLKTGTLRPASQRPAALSSARLAERFESQVRRTMGVEEKVAMSAWREASALGRLERGGLGWA